MQYPSWRTTYLNHDGDGSNCRRYNFVWKLLGYAQDQLRNLYAFAGENRVQMIPLEVSTLATMTAVATFTHEINTESPLYGMTEDLCRNSMMRIQTVIR